jgi:hypothetical protein
VLAAQSERSAEMVRLVVGVRDRLADRYDEADLVAAAAHEVAGEAETAVGPVVVYLPLQLAPTDRDLLRALAGRVPVTVIVGATGDPVADGPARDLVARLEGRPEAGPAAFSAAVVQGTEVLVAPTADAEVLLAARQLAAHNAAGIPLERMAVAHGGNEPYPRLVHDVLTRAGIPFNGTGIRTLAATVAGRTLLGALALVDHDWRRDDVAAWLTSAPLLQRGRAVPASAWDALSCEAGVVAGLGEWRNRLAAHAATLRARAELLEEIGETPGRSLRRDAEQCGSLSAFVEDLARRLDEAPGTWGGWARWARRFLRDLLGEPVHQVGWPAGEIAALDAVLEAVQGLAALGDGHPAPDHLRSALVAELEAPAPQVSRFGHGILVGRVAEMVGLDLDVLCVVGMTDGSFPGRADDDVLVPDREREKCGDEVPLRGARLPEARRDYLAALAAASVRMLSFAAWDQRQGRRQRPSRLLLDTLSTLAAGGRRLYARDLEGLGTHDGYVSIPSFAAAVAAPVGEPVSEADWDLQSLVRWTRDGGDLGRHVLSEVDPVLRAGLALRRERRRPVFTRYDGRVDGLRVPSPAGPSSVGGVVQSPTGLETFARCPRRYLFGTLLGVAVRERPEAVLRVSPLERGNIVHRVLERFIGEELARGRIDPLTPWGKKGDERLRRIAEEVFSDFERRGLTGHDALWRMDRSSILGELRHFLREDDRYRRETGATPEAVEQPFGREGETPVSVPLVGGRAVRFRGTIDRIDRTADGGLSVLDYKTGARHGTEADPVARGTRLQLPVYGLAARERYRPAGPVDVRYWFVSDKGGERGHYARDGFTLTSGGEARFAEVVGTLVTAIEAGRFPGNPAGCAVCPFDRICPADRGRSWERKRSDAWIAGYLAVAEPS